MIKMMLIRGGDIGRGAATYETRKIDEAVVKMSDKEHPNLLFIGLASSYSDSYYDTIKKNYSQLGCVCAYLKKKNILNNPQIVVDKIEKADIIYFGAGDTIKLMTDLKEYKIDFLITKACHNKILVGISAGAIALTREGLSDSYILRGESDKYSFVNGLNLAEICICPHYEKNSKRECALQKELVKNDKFVYALENNTALKITGDKFEVIKSNSNNNAYYCYLDKGKFKTDILSKGNLV